MSDAVKISDMVKEFLVESFDEISNITEGLTELEKSPENSELVHKIYRSMHTIKGAAAFLQFHEIEKFAHQVESALDQLRNDAVPINSEIIDILLKASDTITAALNFIQMSGSDKDSIEESSSVMFQESFKQFANVAPISNSLEENEQERAQQEAALEEIYNQTQTTIETSTVHDPTNQYYQRGGRQWVQSLAGEFSTYLQ
ncbi:MAG: Hpt domain-containing protein [Bdellovibrionales bacterium]|nr:Hpt domain-containing protein [Bdellovibrionales bacterium]